MVAHICNPRIVEEEVGGWVIFDYRDKFELIWAM